MKICNCDTIKKSSNRSPGYRFPLKAISHLIALGVFICILNCCIATPPEYSSDPLASIGKTQINPIFKNIQLGIIHSDNARQAMKYVQDIHRTSSSGLSPQAERDTDPEHLTKGLDRVLNERFHELIVLNNTQDAKMKNVDLIMVLDLRIKMGSRSGKKTTVFISGIFMDTQGSIIDTIQGEGVGVVPWPAWDFHFQQAVNSALKLFSQNLDGSAKLIAQLNRRPPGPEIAAAQTIPSAEKTKHTVEKTSSPVSGKPDFTIGEEKKSPQKAAMTPADQRYGTSKYWAVIIGISRYKHSGQNGLTNLIFADDDAKAFARVLRNLGWSESHIKLLINEQATKRNIEIALESWLTKAHGNDQIVLFWAGHGFPDPEDPEKVYFACFDTDISIPATGYRMDRVRAALEERKSRNVILLADTCHAGKLITRGNRGLSIVPNIDKMRREKTIPKGWIFMVGADTDRQAIEHSSWSNGAFTHSLVKGLSGEADGYESSGAIDNIVTMGELRAYLNSAMPDETQRLLGVAKRAVITTSTGDPDIWDLTLQVQ